MLICRMIEKSWHTCRTVVAFSLMSSNAVTAKDWEQESVCLHSETSKTSILEGFELEIVPYRDHCGNEGLLPPRRAIFRFFLIFSFALKDNLSQWLTGNTHALALASYCSFLLLYLFIYFSSRLNKTRLILLNTEFTLQVNFRAAVA